MKSDTSVVTVTGCTEPDGDDVVGGTVVTYGGVLAKRVFRRRVRPVRRVQEGGRQGQTGGWEKVKGRWWRWTRRRSRREE